MSTKFIDFHDEDTLLDRLAFNANSKKKPVVFLIGAPASGSSDGTPGVPDVDGVVELVREQFKGNSTSISAFERELTHASTNAYQTAMAFLLGRRGQDAVNDVIREAVLQARRDSASAVELISGTSNAESTAEGFEREFGQWHIPNAIGALARLMKYHPETFGRVHLTTNFDPLLSIAAELHGVRSYRSVLSRDGNLAQVQADGAHIVHLHGFWRGADTLHTPRQLTQDRPRLKSSLATLIRGSILVPIAYGGWDDVFTRTLIDVVQEDESRPEILWTFYGSHEADLLAKNSHTLELLSPGIDRGRVQLFKAIDCHSFLDRLADELGALDINAQSMQQTIANVVSESISSAYDNILSRESSESDVPQTDAIPSGFELVGRSDELATIEDEENHIVTISGIGGQGKTSLAAAYAQDCRKKATFDFVDWRDCREQNDTLHTIFLRIVHARRHREIGIEVLRELPVEALAEMIARSLEERCGVLVLDNVDQYIDLETGAALGPLKLLLDRITERRLSSKLILTARPALVLPASPSTYSIALGGLEEQATKTLFEQKSQHALSAPDLKDLHALTNGHPLWISLIAARCRQGRFSMHEILRDIESGKGDLPDRTLSSNWRALNDKQKIVLRTLAELERPLPEEEVTAIDFEINHNQFSKALKALKALALVELKETDNSKSILDLHPLVRQYVRKNFPRTEREKFIAKIILVLDRQLDWLKQIFPNSLPVNVLEVWTHKVDLSLNRGDVETAIDSLVEIEDPMIDSGMGEEFIRLSQRVFDIADWVLLCATSPRFSKLWSHAVALIVEFGKSERAETLLSKYEASIQGRGSQFVNLCNSRCYKLWFEGEFEEAIHWGEQGVHLKQASEADIVYDCAHNLALARRDHGRIDSAKEYFLDGTDEETVLDAGNIDLHRNGSFYGNIGRCYHLSGELDKAIVCYKQSAIILEKDSGSPMNRGYIRQWVGEVLVSLGRYEDAAMFFRAAYELWKGLTPRRSQSIDDQLNQLVERHPSLQPILKMPGWRLENRFSEWMKSST